MKNATYRGIPCWYNPVNDQLKGKNKFYELLIRLNIWFDCNIFDVDEFPLWIEVGEREKN